MTKPLWTSGESRAAQTTLGAFSSWLSSRTGKSLNDYDKLYRFPIENPAELWSKTWDFTKISGDKGAPALPCRRPQMKPHLSQKADRQAAALRQSDPVT